MTLVCAAGCGSYFAKRDVLAGNEAMYRGIRGRDLAALRQLVAADFRYHAPDGKPVDREAWLAAIAAVPGDIVSVEGHRVQVERRADRVTVCGTERTVVRLEGKEQIDDARYCDDWQRRDGRWQIVEAYVPTL